MFISLIVLEAVYNLSNYYGPIMFLRIVAWEDSLHISTLAL